MTTTPHTQNDHTDASHSGVPDGTGQGHDLWQAPAATRHLSATVNVPGSKSLSNRYLILAALGQEPATIHHLLRSRDTELMMQALTTLGVTCETVDSRQGSVRVTPPRSGRFTGNVTVACGLAGTVMRFVPGLALFADGPVTVDGDQQAYARPMQPLLDGLEQLGAHVVYRGEPGHLPLTITPPQTWAAHSGATGQDAPEVAIDSSSSSQFISGLLLIGSRLPHGLRLLHTGAKLPSMPHIRMTMHDIALSGGAVRMPQPGQWAVGPHSLQLPTGVSVEPDLSNAAPFLAAALLAGGTVAVPNWPYHTTQPGGLLPGILHAMHARVELDGSPYHTLEGMRSESTAHQAGLLRVTDAGAIHGLGQYDLSAAGEVAPSIAGLAVFADSPTTLVGIGHLRGHETNRLAALVREIRRIGGDARELPDGLEIRPVPRELMHAETMQTYGDHRMATFAAMVGLVLKGTRVVNIETTRKTLPDFPGMWQTMLEGI